MKRMAILAFTGLAACAPTLDEVRQEPVRWSGEYAVPYESLTNCIAARASSIDQAVPQIYAADGYGLVTMGGGLSEFRVTRTGPTSSKVEWRRGKIWADLGGIEAKTREAADRCGHGA